MKFRLFLYTCGGLFLDMNTFSQNSKYEVLLSLCSNVNYNGGCSIRSYSIEDVSYKKEVRKYLDGISDSELPILKEDDIVPAFGNAFAVGNSTEQEQFVEELTSELRAAKFIVGIMQNQENCSGNESCSFARIRIFTKDGYVIDADMDHTS